MVLPDDSILVCLEGSSPGEAGSGRTHNGGMDIAGGHWKELHRETIK